jgi:predicted ATP-dependent protease
MHHREYADNSGGRRLKAVNIIAGLLVVSVLANIILIAVFIPSQQGMISQLVDKTNTLDMKNMRLQTQLDQQNISLQSYASQLSFYRVTPAGSITGIPGQASYITGFASIQAPAVTQQVVQQNTNGFITQSLVQNGSMMNISVEMRPGEGRVLVQTTPLMGIVFQDAANTAVYVARNKTGEDLSGSDVIFSIAAENQVSSVDGPSAGALMTLVTIAALENRPIDPGVTLTGTIDQNGHIGAIGGVIEKATAAKASGKTLFLLPKENSVIVQYTRKTTNYGGFTLIERVPEQISTQDYITKNIGINVTFVDNIDDVLVAALK